MFVQDIKSPGINITVDVPEAEAKNFQQMCRTFESSNLIGKAIDEYLLKVHRSRPARVVDLTIDVDSDSDEPPPPKRPALENRAADSSSNTNNNSKASSNMDDSSASDNIQTLTKAVMSRKKQIFEDIPATVAGFVSRTTHRISGERDIVNFLRSFFKAHSITVQMKPFGSATYGFGGSETDFNILVNISKKTESKFPFLDALLNWWTFLGSFNDGKKNQLQETFRSFGELFVAPDFQCHFEVLAKLNGNRALPKRFKLYSKATDIVCWLHLDMDNGMAETSQIIRNCILHAPICKWHEQWKCFELYELSPSQKPHILIGFPFISFRFPCSIGYHLIAYLKSWQDALNSAAILKEMQAFQFNSYITSVLVIFYLQLNQNFPKLADVPKASRTKSIDKVPPVDAHLLKQSIRQFFEFYGNFYDFKKHVISVHVGQWEDRQFKQGQQHAYTLEQKRFVCFTTVFAFGTQFQS